MFLCSREKGTLEQGTANNLTVAVIACYAKEFGPRVYGHGVDATILQTYESQKNSDSL